MISRTFALLLLGMSLILGCGEGETSGPAVTTASDQPGTGDTQPWPFDEARRDDQVTFFAPGSSSVLQMDADGSNVQPFTEQREAPRRLPVPDQQRLLNNVCGGSSSFTDPVEMISPDGVSLGPLDDRFSPAWSPIEDVVAVTCGRDNNGYVVVVSDIDVTGNDVSAADVKGGWSRSGRGELSDRMELYLIAVDGSSVTVLTNNQAGEWLPQWHPSAGWLLVESNRDGNSEIYQLTVSSTASWRLTDRDADDQAPVWSKRGEIVAFTSNANGMFEVHTVPFKWTDGSLATGQAGRPTHWGNR